MELRSIVNQLKEGTIKNVETEGLAYINDMGSTSRLPRRVLVDEMNQYIDQINVYLPANKKVPHAVLQSNGDIWAPHFTLTKKAYGGWLDKYQLAGPVAKTPMPADVLMDPKKMAQWMKDHPEVTAQKAISSVPPRPIVRPVVSMPGSEDNAGTALRRQVNLQNEIIAKENAVMDQFGVSREEARSLIQSEKKIQNYSPEISSVDDATFGIIAGCIYSAFLRAYENEKRTVELDDMQEFNKIIKEKAPLIKKAIK